MGRADFAFFSVYTQKHLAILLEMKKKMKKNNAVKDNMMLVTYNGADMSKFAPPHSYINAMDFKSVSALAKYMIQVIILKQVSIK